MLNIAKQSYYSSIMLFFKSVKLNFYLQMLVYNGTANQILSFDVFAFIPGVFFRKNKNYTTLKSGQKGTQVHLIALHA